MPKEKESKLTLELLERELSHDHSVKIAGIDIDGTLRGKLMSKKKFLGVAKEGFGFCSVIFGWDMHDRTYFKELKISNADNGYRDLIAVPDLSSYRRIPWEDDVPFFLVSFLDPDTGAPISACSRGLLKMVADKLEKKGMWAMAGGKLMGIPTLPRDGPECLTVHGPVLTEILLNSGIRILSIPSPNLT